MEDEPNTQAKPTPAVAIIIPTAWTDPGGRYDAFLLITRIDVVVIDFYRGAP